MTERLFAVTHRSVCISTHATQRSASAAATRYAKLHSLHIGQDRIGHETMMRSKAALAVTQRQSDPAAEVWCVPTTNAAEVKSWHVVSVWMDAREDADGCLRFTTQPQDTTQQDTTQQDTTQHDAPRHERYLVTATHIAPEHACTDRVFTVHRGSFPSDPTRPYSASAMHYGCSKDYATPEAAIRGMLSDWCCTVVSIRKA